jgi:hypothetical protein
MSVNRAGDGLRVAAVVVGAIGALIGMLKGLLSILLWGSVGVGTGTLLTNSYLHIIFLSNGLILLSCVLGLVGALFAGRGRSGVGAALFIANLVGIAAAVVLFVILLEAIMSPIQEIDPSTATSPDEFFYIASLAPVPLLLVAAALAFLVRGRSRAA